MGTGINVPRAVTMRLLLLLCLAIAGCIDFVEPELPDRGAPAVLVLTVRMMDTGTVQVEGRLVPGLDAAGVPRRVLDARIRVLGRSVAPDSTSANGTRVYRSEWAHDNSAATGPVEAKGPELAGLTSTPAIRWYALRRDGSSVVDLEPGADLPLQVDVDAGTAQPEPDIRQWFLTLSDSAQVFRLSANGPPPSEILVPARWVPAGDSLAALLIYQQSSKIESPASDYIGLVTVDVRTSWTARRTAGGASGKGGG